MDPRRLRSELLNGTSGDLCRRRAVVALSLVGVASMAATSLLQMGLIRHLPDPPFAAFDSDKVNLSTEAYKFGAPDGTLGLASYAANLPLAAFGGAGRARTMPWLPLLAAAKAAADAAVAVWYFYQMPAKEKAWCAYCLVAQGATLGVLALTLPEARRALAALRP
jgi:uncharacterized membrane protein